MYLRNYDDGDDDEAVRAGSMFDVNYDGDCCLNLVTDRMLNLSMYCDNSIVAAVVVVVDGIVVVVVDADAEAELNNTML